VFICELFERLQQRFAVRAGAIVCRNQQDGTFAKRGSERQEVPVVAMIEDFRAKCVG
jgi:hypothetical protein